MENSNARRRMILIAIFAFLIVIPRSLVAADEPKMTDAQLRKSLRSSIRPATRQRLTLNLRLRSG